MLAAEVEDIAQGVGLPPLRARTIPDRHPVGSSMSNTPEVVEKGKKVQFDDPYGS